jgi:hypothetical protein
MKGNKLISEITLRGELSNIPAMTAEHLYAMAACIYAPGIDTGCQVGGNSLDSPIDVPFSQ